MKKSKIMSIYSYQPSIVKEVFHQLQNNPSNGVVLAATPGAGKTNMAIEICRQFIDCNPQAKVLVLTHGQTYLRTQFFERMDKVKFPYSFGELNSNNSDLKQVNVALPHYFNNNAFKGEFDLIVIDEAHQFFTANMVQNILNQSPKAKLLLLTGSPSQFIKDNYYPLVSITASELLDYGVLTDPYIELVQTNLPFTVSDYNYEEDLRQDVEMTDKQVYKALDSGLRKLFNAVHTRLESPIRAPETNSRWISKSVRLFMYREIGKTLVICNSQAQARTVLDYFNKNKIKALISTSDTDTDSDNIYSFKEDDSTFLIVVNRATLGFDYPELMNVVDISCSMNPDRIFQALCRVVRKSNERLSSKKLYIKITPTSLAPLTHHVMSFVVALSQPQYYNTYDGNWKNTKIPILGDIERAIKEHQQSEAKAKKGSNPPQISLPSLYTFSSIKHIDQAEYAPYAWSSFTECKRLLSENAQRVAENKKAILEAAEKLRASGKTEFSCRELINAGASEKLYEYIAPSTEYIHISFRKELIKLGLRIVDRSEERCEYIKNQVLEQVAAKAASGLKIIKSKDLEIDRKKYANYILKCSKMFDGAFLNKLKEMGFKIAEYKKAQNVPLEEVEKEMLKYKSRTDFKKHNGVFYKIAIKSGIIRKLSPVYTYYDVNTIKEIGIGCNSKKDFKERYHSAYNAARRLGVLDSMWPSEKEKALMKRQKVEEFIKLNGRPPIRKRSQEKELGSFWQSSKDKVASRELKLWRNEMIDKYHLDAQRAEISDYDEADVKE